MLPDCVVFLSIHEFEWSRYGDIVAAFAGLGNKVFFHVEFLFEITLQPILFGFVALIRLRTYHGHVGVHFILFLFDLWLFTISETTSSTEEAKKHGPRDIFLFPRLVDTS